MMQVCPIPGPECFACGLEPFGWTLFRMVCAL
uniref:Uncharacterized protein n=1 Tax=Anguilla anguilla TaxID=7936 RepID=A0A0E9QJ97_ANGAN